MQDLNMFPLTVDWVSQTVHTDCCVFLEAVEQNLLPWKQRSVSVKTSFLTRMSESNYGRTPLHRTVFCFGVFSAVCLTLTMTFAFIQDSGQWPGCADFSHAEQCRPSREEHPTVRGAADFGKNFERNRSGWFFHVNKVGLTLVLGGEPTRTI